MTLWITSEIWLKEDPLLRQILVFFQHNSLGEVYLVGGYLRDKLIGRKSKDIDLLIEGDVLRAGEGLESYLKGSFFFLGKARGIARLIVRKPAPRVLDLISLKKSLKEDLKNRDFTIDALALNLKSLTRKALSVPDDLIDFSGGLSDLEKRLIRAVSASTFQEDPLRLLRSVRLQAELGFVIESETRSLTINQAELISKVSPERILDELFLILASRQSSKAIKEADSLGLVKIVLPELESLKGVTQDRYHHLDVWGHSLLTLEELERITGDIKSMFPVFAGQIESQLRKQVQGRSRLSLLKLGALFHDLGKSQTRSLEGERIRFLGHSQSGAILSRDILSRLKLGKRATQLVCRLVEEHLRPGFLSQQRVTPRAIQRFFRDCGEEALEVILLSQADRLASRGPSSTVQELDRHHSFLESILGHLFAEKAIPPSPLLRGSDLLSEFDLEPGPIIGRLLKAVEGAQFEGKISSRREALLLIQEILAKKSSGDS